jgi:hypothetical protein
MGFGLVMKTMRFLMGGFWTKPFSGIQLLFEMTDKRNMEKRINYEDNTFIINTRIRLLHDIFMLEADPELFFKKTLDEIDFINDVLDVLLKALIDNDKLIERGERLHDLLETEWRFTSLLNFLIGGQGSLAGNYHPQLIPKLESVRNDCIRRRDLINEHDASFREGDRTDERLVSAFELAELLKEE